MEALITHLSYNFFAIFLRVAGFFSSLPTIISIPYTIKLVLHLSISIIIFNNLTYNPFGDIQQLNFMEIIGILAFEFLVGVFLGAFAGIFIHSMNLVGYYCSQATALGNIMFPDFNNEQNAIMSKFFTLIAVILIFATDLLIYLIQALHISYEAYNMNNISIYHIAYGSIKIGNILFESAFRFSMPFIFTALCSYALMAFINKLSPKISVLFMAMPGQIVLGIFIISIFIFNLEAHFIEAYKEYAFMPYQITLK